MSQVLERQTSHIDSAIQQLFDTKSPVLVEVQFPGMATSSDWYLCQDSAEYEQIANRLTTGVKLRLASVFDLQGRSTLERIR